MCTDNTFSEFEGAGKEISVAGGEGDQFRRLLLLLYYIISPFHTRKLCL